MGKAGTRTLLGEFPTNRKTCKYIYGIRIYVFLGLEHVCHVFSIRLTYIFL